jgi:hypothetical protein
MAVGFIDPEPREKVRPPRKQVLVVVTASLQVLAFDHNLALMWEVAIAESMPRNAHLAEVGCTNGMFSAKRFLCGLLLPKRC